MLNKIDAKTLRDMILSGSNNLQNHKDLVDKLNVFPVPDGGCETYFHPDDGRVSMGNV